MKKIILTYIVLLTAFAVNAENKIELKANGTSTYSYFCESELSFKGAKSVNQKQNIKYSIETNQIGGKKKNIFQFISIRCDKNKKDSTTVLDTEKPRLPLSYIMKRATNKSYESTLSKKNLTNDSIIGSDSIKAHLFDDFVKLPDSTNQVVYRHLIKEEYGDNLVRGLIENSMSIAPDSAVKEKGTWTKSMNRYGNFISNSATVYTLKEKKGNTYIISGVNQIDKAKSCRYSLGGIAYLLEEVEGQIVSDIELDAVTGLLKSSTTQINAKAKATPLSISESTDESISSDIVLSIKQTITKE